MRSMYEDLVKKYHGFIAFIQKNVIKLGPGLEPVKIN